MNFSEFKGIKQYHDGTAVSDYNNVIPLGNSVIDRLGEERLYAGTGTPRGSFRDSLGNIYIVIADKVHRYTYDGVAISGHSVMQGRYGNTIIDDYTLKSLTGAITFCESTVKPSQVYLCDGQYIYQWNTEDEEKHYSPMSDHAQIYPWHNAFIIRMMIVPDVMPIGYGTDVDTQLTMNDIDPYYIYETGASPTSEALLDLSTAVKITAITWFDNKLVLVQREKNTVWLSATDPNQFYRLTRHEFENDGAYAYLPAVSMWNDDGTESKLWYSWYASTNSADRLNTAIGFGGNLYLQNEATIEPWSRTGNEDAPLSANSLSTIYHGGRNPIIIANTLFIICRDQAGNEFIGALQGTELTRISNTEIEQRINNKAIDLVTITMRDETFLAVRMATGISYCYNRMGFWWKLQNPIQASEYAVWSIARDIAVSNNGSIIRFINTSRTLCDGTAITRSIRDFFMHFDGRKICRSIELVMDTGKSCDTTLPTDVQKTVYCRVSFDRGHSFGPYRYRVLGQPGNNDVVIIWRNAGSGNSLLPEFGTSANYQFQLYQVKIQIA